MQLDKVKDFLVEGNFPGGHYDCEKNDRVAVVVGQNVEHLRKQRSL